MSLTIIDENHIFQKDVIGKVRTAQEDSHDMAVLTPNGDVFVVCDGMGGHVGGKQASSIAVKSILECLEKEKYGNPLQALNDALQFANMQILGYANNHPELKGMGTTACILLLQGDEAYIAHAGDSRIYLYLGKEKQLHRITKDHSFVQTLVDAGEISDEEAEHHPNKNRILKALGIKPALEPTFSARPILPKNGDVFLICSDGLSGMLPDNAIESVMSQNAAIKQKGDMLINLALEEGGLDNITLQLIQISNSPHKKSIFKSYNPKSGRKSSVSKSKKLKKILVAVLIVILCIIGGYAAYFIINKKSKEEKIELLRTNIDNAEKKYKDSETAFYKDEDEYNKIAEKTKEAKERYDANKDDEKFKNAYDKQKNRMMMQKKKLENLRQDMDSARNKADQLKNSFEQDSINIINSK
jgi:protein phosphatase